VPQTNSSAAPATASSRARDAWIFLRTPFEGIHPVVLVVFGVSTAFSFFFFVQPDLWHTVVSSYAYYHGHIGDFYDYGEATIGRPAYLPSIYWIFALWMAPIALIGAVNPRVDNSIVMGPIEHFWARLLLLLVFAATFYLVSAIAKHAFPANEVAQRIARTGYLLSPLVGFAVFTFGQYDIIGVFFTLLGVLMYFRRNSFWFVFWFSIAITFKYFAAFLFIPLALFYFKRPLKIALALLGGVAFTAIEFLIYWSSPAFRIGAVQIAEGKATSPLQNPLQVLMGVLFLALCLTAFLYGRRRDDLARPLILIWIAAYPIMLLAVTWHPQWTVLLAPGFALALGLMKRPGWFLLAESIGFAAFITVVVSRWQENVDAVMITRGILSAFVNDPQLLQRDLGSTRLEPYAGVLVTILFVLPLLWLLLERAGGVAEKEVREPRTWIWVIRAATVLLTFTLPSLVFTLIPRDVALSLNPSAVQYGAVAVGPPEGAAAPHAQTPEDSYEQEIVVEGDGLAGVRIPTATYLRENVGTIEVTITGPDGSEVAEKDIDSSSLRSDAPIYLVFPPEADSGGETYTLTIEQSAASAANVVGFWTVEDVQGDEPDVVINGDETDAVLDFTYYLVAPAA
jgi:hypothetical protein